MLVRLLKEKGLLSIIVVWIIVLALLIFKLLFETEPPVFTDMLTTHWAFGWLQGQLVIMLSLGVALVVTSGIVARPFFRRLDLGSRSGNIEILIMPALKPECQNKPLESLSLTDPLQVLTFLARFQYGTALTRLFPSYMWKQESGTARALYRWKPTVLFGKESPIDLE